MSNLHGLWLPHLAAGGFPLNGREWVQSKTGRLKIHDTPSQFHQFVERRGEIVYHQLILQIVNYSS